MFSLSNASHLWIRKLSKIQMLDGSFNGCAWYNWLLRNRYVYKSGFASKNCYVWNCNISIVCWNCSSQNTGRLRKYHTCFRAVVGCYFNRTRMMPVFVDPAYPAWRHPMANLKKKYFTLPTTYFAPPFSSHRSRVSLFGHDAFVVCVCVCVFLRCNCKCTRCNGNYTINVNIRV